MTIREVIDLTEAMGISGVPVVEGKETVGIVTPRPAFRDAYGCSGVEVMTPKDSLVTVGEGARDDEVSELLHKHRIEKVLVVKMASNSEA